MRARSAVAALAALAACDDLPARPDAAETPWRRTTDMPEPRLEGAAVAMGTRLAVVGGYSSSLDEGLTVSRTVLLFDTFDESWSTLTPDLPVAWTHAGIASIGGALFVLGGLDRELAAHGEAFVLDLGSRVWETMTPMPAGTERGAAAIVVEPPYAYLFGGSQTATGAVATNLAVDLSSSVEGHRGVWTELPPLPSARSHAAAMRLENGTFIVAGGIDAAGTPLAETLALEPGATAWTPRAPMATARGGCAYAVVYGRLLCAGGETASAAVRDVEGYDPETDTWTRYADLPEPRAGVHGAAIGQRLYVPGGAAALRFEPTSAVFVFSLLDTIGARDLGSP